MKQKMITSILGLCAVMGWCGTFYPQFTLLDGTYRIVCENPSVQESQEVIESQTDRGQLYWTVLSADSDQIRLKCKLLEDIYAWKEARREIHDSGHE